MRERIGIYGLKKSTEWPLVDLDKISLENRGPLVLVLDAGAVSDPRIQQLNSQGLLAGVVVVVSESSHFRPDSAWLLNFQKLHVQAFVGADSSQLGSVVMAALESVQKQEQLLQLVDLANDQQARLKSLYGELEARVEKRQRYLLEARRKSFAASQRWASAQQASVAVAQAQTLVQIEESLLQALRTPLKIQKCKISLSQAFSGSRESMGKAGFVSLAIPLLSPNNGQGFGEMVLYRESSEHFEKEDVDYLERLSEVVALAVQRMLRQDELLILQDQWQATFNAILDPVSLTREDYGVLQANRAFTAAGELKSRRCFEVLFQRTVPCPGCQRGGNFTLEMGGKVFEVRSQKLSSDGRGQMPYFNHYRDVTQQRKLLEEIRALESKVELGNMSGSIAHELNNPLAGILSYVQLLRMDVSPEQEFAKDLAEMEQAVQRCRAIIEKLLGQARTFSPESGSHQA